MFPGQNYSYQAAKYAHKVADIRPLLLGDEATDKKMVFLTFDDGVNWEVTPRILDILREEQVPATFFVVGKYLTEDTKALLQREITEGHAIAIHSFTHEYELLYPNNIADPERVISEVKQTQTILQSLLGKQFFTHVWRYPGGHMSWQNTDIVDERLSSEGIEWIDWNAVSGDAEVPDLRPTTPAAMLEYLQQTMTLTPNATVRVVLMHDAVDKELTIQSLPDIIRYFREQGYQFGVLS